MTLQTTQVIWHGHSNVQVTAGGVSVIVDPFFSGNPSAVTGHDTITPPDIVLVTHDHGDHVGDAVALCKRTGALCGCIVGTAEVLIAAGLPREQVPATIGFNIGGSIEHKGVRVTMTEAFHTSQSGAPAGYIVTMPNGFTFYHAGDTGVFCNMETLGHLYPLDLACLPIGGFFTMDGLQAAHAVKMLKPRVVLPMHFGTFPVLAKTSSDFGVQLKALGLDTPLVALKPGSAVTL